MNWGILEIEETKDLRAIKAAYMKKLKTVNPEDSPAEFMELRAAYEEATRLAAQETEEAAGDALSLWMKRVEDVYWDYTKRKDALAWRELLDSAGSESVPPAEAEQGLLNFLSENWILPQAAWKEINDHFGLLERTEELYGSYPAAYVDNVILWGIRNREVLPCEDFTPGVDGHAVDEYAHLYYSLKSGSEEEPEQLKKLMGMKEHHPMGDAWNACYEWKNGKEEAEETCQKLVAEYPSEEVVLLLVERAYFQKEMCDKALAVLEPYMGLHKDHMQIRVEYVFCLSRNERYREAYDEYCLIMKRFDDVNFKYPSLAECSEFCCQQLVEQYEKAIESGEASNIDKVDAAWWYIGSDRGDEAYNILIECDPEEIEGKEISYYSGLFSICYDRGEFEEAVENVLGAIESIRGLEPDGTEKTELNLKRIPEMRCRLGMCYYNQGRTDEGLAILRSAAEESDYSSAIVIGYTMLLMHEHRFSEAVSVMDSYTDRHGRLSRFVFLKGEALFNLYADREAYDNFSIFINEGYPYLAAYVYRVHILIRNGSYDNAREALEEVKKVFLGDDITENDYPDIPWLEAYLNIKTAYQAISQHEQDPEHETAPEVERYQMEKSALQEYERIEGLIKEKKYNAYWISSFYLQYAEITESVSSVKNEYDPEQLCAIAQKGLEYDDCDKELVRYYCRKKFDIEANEEAYDMMYRLFKLGGLGQKGRRDLAAYLLDNIDTKADRLLEVYEAIISFGYEQEEENEEENEDDGNPFSSIKCEDRFYAGVAAYRLGDLERAEHHFNIIETIDPEETFRLRGLAIISLARGENEKAVGYIDRALEIADPEKIQQQNYYHLIRIRIIALRRLGRWKEAVEDARRLERNERELLIHKIYLQFGQFDADYRHLMWWKDHRREFKYSRDVRAAIMDYWTLQGKNTRCGWSSAGLVFDPTVGNQDYEELSNHQAASGLFVEAVHFWNSSFAEGYDDYVGIYCLVKTLLMFRMTSKGHKVPRTDKKNAEKVLPRADELIAEYSGEVSRHIYNKALLLAILGRREEALELAQRMKSGPKCTVCPYSCCMEAEIVEMYVEAFTGDRDKALEMCRRNMEKWPGVAEFRIAGKYLGFHQ